MKRISQLVAMALTGLLIPACSGTTMSGSWSDPGYQGQIKNVYIIGLAEKKNSRRIFEDTFNRQLGQAGINSISSYNDLTDKEEMSQEIIKQRMIENGADSVLLTKLISQRTESVTSAGRIYGSDSYRGRGSAGGWGRYSSLSYDVAYQPSTTTQFVILTIESVLYDLKSEKMIWSAELETDAEGNIEKLMQGYVNTVITDLKKKGLIYK